MGPITLSGCHSSCHLLPPHSPRLPPCPSPPLNQHTEGVSQRRPRLLYSSCPMTTAHRHPCLMPHSGCHSSCHLLPPHSPRLPPCPSPPLNQHTEGVSQRRPRLLYSSCPMTTAHRHPCLMPHSVSSGWAHKGAGEACLPQPTLHPY